MKLAINRCHDHGVWSISIDGETSGTRATPQKCCGRSSLVVEWTLSEYAWTALATLARDAAESTREAEEERDGGVHPQILRGGNPE